MGASWGFRERPRLRAGAGGSRQCTAKYLHEGLPFGGKDVILLTTGGGGSGGGSRGSGDGGGSGNGEGGEGGRESKGMRG